MKLLVILLNVNFNNPTVLRDGDAVRARPLSLMFLLCCSSDSHLEVAVVEVIDHHLLEREPSQSCPVTVDTVGSCATLVSEVILQKAPQILDQQVAQLLYGKQREGYFEGRRP